MLIGVLLPLTQRKHRKKYRLVHLCCREPRVLSPHCKFGELIRLFFFFPVGFDSRKKDLSEKLPSLYLLSGSFKDSRRE